MSHEPLSLEDALKTLHDAYRRKQYKQVVHIGGTVLTMAPQSLEVKEMIREAQMFLALQRSKRNVWLATFAILIALATAVGFAYEVWVIQPALVTGLESQNQKYLGLIKENGVMHGSRTELSQQLELVKSQLSMLTVRVQTVSDKLNRKRESRVDEKDQQIEGLQTKIDQQNNEIQKLINLTVTQVKSQKTFNYGENIRGILILGDHGGLTDTIMVAAINPSLKTVSLISIPRDLYIDGRKINEIYRNFGADTLKVYLHDITGLTISDYVRVDLAGFRQVVDLLGGIDLNVEKDIEDKNYPTGDGNVETFSLSSGWQHLDGATALKYARTRHGDSDFERAKRQQKVIEATLTKANAMGITDVAKLLEFGSTILGNVTSTLNVFQAMGLYQDYKDFRLESNNVLSTANYLSSSKSIHAEYILLPKDGTYKEIQEFVYGVVMK